MTNNVSFYLNQKLVQANESETIWDVAKKEDIDIPHLCHSDKIGYKADGNCRACVVEVKGEKSLVASCIRKPTQGIKVFTNNEKVKKSQNLVLELLLTDQPNSNTSRSKNNHFWKTLKKRNIKKSRFSQKKISSIPKIDNSHSAMTVDLNACIQCGLCIRACRDVQVNDVLGMSGRGNTSYPVFDLDKLMGDSSCVGCGECVQACPTGAIIESALLDENNNQTIYLIIKSKAYAHIVALGVRLL
jgi:formate dehydrogenase major subunit